MGNKNKYRNWIFVGQDLKINSFVNSQPSEASPTSRNSPVTKIPIACTPNFPNVPVKKVNSQLFLAICVGVELWLWHQINVGGGKVQVQSFLLFIEKCFLVFRPEDSLPLLWENNAPEKFTETHSNTTHRDKSYSVRVVQWSIQAPGKSEGPYKKET